MNIFKTLCVKSEAELHKLFVNIGLKVSYDGPLCIVKLTVASDLEAVKKIETRCYPFQIKGLIYDYTTGAVIAPGVLIPDNASQLEDLNSLEGIVSYITSAQDGVMFRLYEYNGIWLISTNGMITPL